MRAAPVELRVGGQTYRVVASADEDELHRLAETVDERLHRLTPVGRQVGPQTMLLAAIELAHDLEEARRARRQLEERHRTALRAVLGRIDAVLTGTAAASAPSAADPELDLDPDLDLDLEPDFSVDPDPPLDA